MPNKKLNRIAVALEALATRWAPEPFLLSDKFVSDHDGFVWETDPFPHMHPVSSIATIPFELLASIDHVRDILLQNTVQFAHGHAANNALLWGARGMGKSTLVKSTLTHINKGKSGKNRLKLIEIHREDIDTLPALLRLISDDQHRFILFCDDLSFDHDDTSYKSLKSVLDGGLAGRPENVIFYATSNRRHLMPREMIDNERSSAINPGEAVQEKVSLSDRFGLWLGFHACSQDDYLTMLRGYMSASKIDIAEEIWRAEALEWSTTRGSRSGRVAWQFMQHFAGKHGIKLELE